MYFFMVALFKSQKVAKPLPDIQVSDNYDLKEQPLTAWVTVGKQRLVHLDL